MSAPGPEDARFDPGPFDPSRFERARQVADAVLYEGYVLYPYRASAQKNRLRWQFGVLVPPAYAAANPSEHWASQTEVPVEVGDGASPLVQVRVRFFHLQARQVEEAVPGEPGAFRAVEALEADGRTLATWDEGIEQTVDATVLLGAILDAEHAVPFTLPGAETTEPICDATGAVVGRIVRRRWPLAGVLRLGAERIERDWQAENAPALLRLRVRTENATAWGDGSDLHGPRSEALRGSLIAAHTMLAVSDGADSGLMGSGQTGSGGSVSAAAEFVSLLEPPPWAQSAVDGCSNLQTWPVLIGLRGQRDVMLSSPIILYDYPEIAPESPGDLFDATEIDELLTLRTLTLTDAEKEEARGTDDRAAAILDRVDAMPPEILDRLHGTMRYLRQAPGPASVEETVHVEETGVPWWSPDADDSVSPETDRVLVGGVAVRKGSLVRLRPGPRRADAHDMFLAGRVATVQAVYFDVENGAHLAVTLDDDPAAELFGAQGRFLFFRPDEVEPLALAETSESGEVGP